MQSIPFFFKKVNKERKNDLNDTEKELFFIKVYLLH